MADRATIAARLAEAETARHRLSMGMHVAEVRDAAGRTIKYTPAEAPALDAYILDLKMQIAMVDGPSATTRRPIRISF